MLSLAVMVPSSLAWAEEPTVTYPSAEETDAGYTSWRGHRAGPHVFVDVGVGAFYAPDLAITFRPTSTTGDSVTLTTEGLHGPAALARWGLALGVSRYVDLELGVGSFLGGAILSVDDQFFAYPHALFSVAFGPGSVYRARIGLTLGALLFEEDDARATPGIAQFATQGEVAPLILRFGPHDTFEISLTQGIGVLVGSELKGGDPCEILQNGSCVSATPVAGGPDAVFAAHTTLAFGALVD
jgi:hypothetical protein